jgi:hypothetical protein
MLKTRSEEIRNTYLNLASYKMNNQERDVEYLKLSKKGI